MKVGTLTRILRMGWRPGLAACVLLVGAFKAMGESTSDACKENLVRIQGGVFIMGSREGDADAQPIELCVSNFMIGRYEVTVGEYAEYLNSAGIVNSSPTPQMTGGQGRYAPRWLEKRKPIAYVDRADAENYCWWMSERTGLKVRLPTEAEWEYAARGGIPQARYPWGWGEPQGRACFDAKGPCDVGRYEPNGYGLYDMAGNVYEWCVGPTGTTHVVARGGSWAERDPAMLRVFQRGWFRFDYRDADVGFRIVAEEEPAP